MPEQSLGAAMRLLLGVAGVAALFAGAVVAIFELGRLARGAPAVPTLAATVVAVLALSGGLQLVRGAWRGRIRVRRTNFRRSGGSL